MQINNVRIYGLEESIIASGFPMLNKELTNADFEKQVYELKHLLKNKKFIQDFINYQDNYNKFKTKEDSISFKNSIKHYKRILKLANAPVGSGHDAALKGIVVQFNCHAPQYFWQQLQRYHFIDIISSMSKMHRINKMGLTDACMKETNYEAIYNANEAINYYDAGEIDIDSVLANIPMGLEYTARLTTNYLQLKTIYKQRKNHRSNQWKVFCEWIKTLPLAEELIINEDSTSQKL